MDTEDRLDERRQEGEGDAGRAALSLMIEKVRAIPQLRESNDAN